LRGAPSAYNRAPNFFRVPGPQIYTLTTGNMDISSTASIRHVKHFNTWLAMHQQHNVHFKNKFL